MKLVTEKNPEFNNPRITMIFHACRIIIAVIKSIWPESSICLTLILGHKHQLGLKCFLVINQSDFCFYLNKWPAYQVYYFLGFESAHINIL